MKRQLLTIVLACGTAGAIAALSAISGCNSAPSATPDMKMMCNAFADVPECKPGELALTPLKGSRQMVISTLSIANYNEGFDLNCDGKVDNKLSPLAALANSAIAESFQLKHDVVVPIEMFGYEGKDTECAKFAFYLGRVLEDRDGDGRETTWEAGKSDCLDTDKNVRPGAKEDPMNRLDDDCDGFADNAMPMSPPADKTDVDGDGQSMADGDCDDRGDAMNKALAMTRKKGAKDVCGNGIDEDCNGISDDDTSCDPFKDNNRPMHVQSLSFSNPGMPGMDGTIPSAGLKPLITFPNGKVKNNELLAGPNLFELNLAIDADIQLKLTLSGARVGLKMKEMNGGTYITEGRLAGVLQAISLAQIHIDAGGILKKEQSLLDGVFVGPAATILGLESDKDGHYLPDIDADGDGLETFWQDDTGPGPDGGARLAIVDTCKDGDGTIVKNNFDGKGTLCPFAKDAKGNYRFVDGLSAALKFQTVPAKLQDVTVK